jgi:hypothetical protein
VTAAVKVEASASGNPISCVVGGCDVQTSVSLEAAVAASVGFNYESSQVDTAEKTWDPNAQAIAGYESLQTLREAERDAQIEGANSNAYIKQKLLEQSELLGEWEIALVELNKVAAEHNQLVAQYRFLTDQRAQTIDSIRSGYLAKPYFRLERDSAAARASDTLDRAVQVAYLTAKALEYEQLHPIAYLNTLYQVRNTGDLRKFLDRLDIDFNAIDHNLFSKRESRLSLARDILGLTDQNLNPTGRLTPAQVEQLRYQRFQEFLRNAHIVNAARGVNKFFIPFTTYLDMPNGPFFVGASHYRISRVGNNDPGCSTGCRGVWLNLVTDQRPGDFSQSGPPAIVLTHGGHATYRNGAGQIVTYDPGPAAIIGQSLPPGFGNETRSILLSTHLNLAPNPADPASQPNPNFTVSGFHNLSVFTSQWGVEINMQETSNRSLDITKLRDIEVRMDATYLTTNLSQQFVEMETRRVDAMTAGQTVPADVQRFMERYEREQAALRGAANAARLATHHALPTANQPAGDQFFGTMFVNTPANLGVVDIGFTLALGSDGKISGALCATCTPLYTYKTAPTLTGAFDTATKKATFTASFTQTIGGRTVQRRLQFTGQLKQQGQLLEGTYKETIDGYTDRPIVTEGTFLVSRLSRLVETPTSGIKLYLPLVAR